ncbi:MAG TPA: SWIM zinc finger family protein [Polyangiaceae bacterium]
MSFWRSREWFRSAPKKPPPGHGIRVKKPGSTWWGQHWIDALEKVLHGHAGRLARGKTYARAGRTHDLTIENGTVTAKVTGTRETPYAIRIELAQLDESSWQRAITAMASKAQFCAELLAGQMPQAIDEAFAAAGASLFPRRRAELGTSCTCPDSGDPCKHIAATHYVLGEALDRDPFLLFELRGKTKEQVLAGLRAARGEPGPEHRAQPASARRARKGKSAPSAATHEVPTVKLGRVKAADYDRPREALPSLHFTFDEPTAHGAVLRQLGVPAAWQSAASPADALAPLVRAAAEKARRMALAEPSEPAQTPEPPTAPSRRKRARSR